MTRKLYSAVLTALTIAGLAIVPVLAQGQQGQQQQQQGKQRAPGQEQKTDVQVEQFITKVAHSGHAEVALAQLALIKSNSEQVKAVAKKLLTHSHYRHYLLDARSKNRIFALNLPRIWLAYATGSMRYGLLTAHKPSSSS